MADDKKRKGRQGGNDGGYGGYSGRNNGGDFSYILGAHKRMEDMRKVFGLLTDKKTRGDDSSSDSDHKKSSQGVAKQILRESRKQAGKESLPDEKIECAWVFHACAANAHTVPLHCIRAFFSLWRVCTVLRCRCTAPVVENIIAGGFNRSYAGKNATLYGPGW